MVIKSNQSFIKASPLVLRIHVINIEQLVTSAVEMYHKERVPHNLGLDMPNQDPHNQDAQPHMDGREETAQVNSGKTTPLDSPSEVETGKAGRGEGEGGGEGDGGGDGGQKDDGKRDGAVVGELSGSVRLSTVGALGEKAYNALTCGTVVDDHLMISILMEEIRLVQVSRPSPYSGMSLAQVIAQWMWMGAGEFPHNSGTSQGECLQYTAVSLSVP